MSNYYLVKFSKDWADEFEGEGFRIIETEVWEEQKKFMRENPDANISSFFGTNQGWDTSETGEVLGDFQDSYTDTFISNETKKELEKILPYGLGIFPWPTAIVYTE